MATKGIRFTEAAKDALALVCAELRDMRDAAIEVGREAETPEARIWWAGKYAGLADAETFLEGFLAPRC